MSQANSEKLQNILSSYQISQASDLFRRAINEDSNYENEWLWYADEVSNDKERLYCLKRALYINPHNHKTVASLQALNRKLSTQQAQTTPMPGSLRNFTQRLTAILQY